MQKTKELVHKPNKTIMVTNAKITVNQRKAYNVILHKAWGDLKINGSQTVFELELSVLKQKAGIKATDNWHLKQDMNELSDIKVENVKENGDWSIFRLISSARKKGNVLQIELPVPIREALLSNNYYTTIDLLIIRSLEGKHAVILYEMAIRYQKKQIPEMTIEELRLLTGTMERKSYNNFGLFKVKVLTPAIEEINAKTDIFLDYTTTTQGKKIVTVKFVVKSKESRELISAPEEISATSEIIPGQMTLDEALVADQDQKGYIQKILEPLKLSKKDVAAIAKCDTDIDIEQLRKYVGSIKKSKTTPDNVTGLLIYAIKKKLAPESITLILKSQKKPSNRDNFDQREYSEEYYDNFFYNGV